MKKAVSIIVLFALLFSLCGCGETATDNEPTLKLNGYVSFSFSGSDGAGRAKASFNYKKLLEDYQDKIETMDASTLDELFRSSIKVSFDKNQYLRNGDKVTLVWECNDQLIKETIGYRLKYDNIVLTVKDLTGVASTDLFDEIEISFEKYNTHGEAYVSYMDMRYSDAGLVVTIEPSKNLSNGDKVTVSITDSAGNIPSDSFAKEKFGFVPSSWTKEYTVSGLYYLPSTLGDMTNECIAKLREQSESGFFKDVLPLMYVSIENYDVRDIVNLDKLEYVGNFIRLYKDSDRNEFFLIYKVTMKLSASRGDNSFEKTISFYWYEGYEHFAIGADGFDYAYSLHTPSVDLLALNSVDYEKQEFNYYCSLTSFEAVKKRFRYFENNDRFYYELNIDDNLID